MVSNLAPNSRLLLSRPKGIKKNYLPVLQIHWKFPLHNDWTSSLLLPAQATCSHVTGREFSNLFYCPWDTVGKQESWDNFHGAKFKHVLCHMFENQHGTNSQYLHKDSLGLPAVLTTCLLTVRWIEHLMGWYASVCYPFLSSQHPDNHIRHAVLSLWKKMLWD